MAKRAEKMRRRLETYRGVTRGIVSGWHVVRGCRVRARGVKRGRVYETGRTAGWRRGLAWQQPPWVRAREREWDRLARIWARRLLVAVGVLVPLVLMWCGVIGRPAAPAIP